jgi:hypothetical protein
MKNKRKYGLNVWRIPKLHLRKFLLVEGGLIIEASCGQIGKFKTTDNSDNVTCQKCLDYIEEENLP